MEIVRELDEQVWRDFVYNHPQGQIFHTPEMFQVFARAKGYRPTMWAAVDCNGRPLALLLPVQIMLRDGVLRYLTTRAVVYGSVLCVPGQEGEAGLSALLQAYRGEVKGSVLFTELRNLSDMNDFQSVLNDCNFIYEGHLNYLIDLSRPLEEIWQSIRSNAKRNIKKALKSQVIINEIKEPDQLVVVYALLKNVYQRLEVPLADISLFRAAFEILYPLSMIKIAVAKIEDADIGVATLLLYKDIAYYWYAGIIKEYASYRPADLLVWHTLEWSQQKQFRVFDFGGAGRPNEEYGVRDFKAKFGGALVNYGRNTCIHAPMRFGLSQLGYQLLRRFL